MTAILLLVVGALILLVCRDILVTSCGSQRAPKVEQVTFSRPVASAGGWSL